jgi:hypothetical protein
MLQGGLMSILRLAADTVRLMPAATAVQPPAGGAPPIVGATAPSSALNAVASLTTFIPAETITLFVAVIGIVAGWKTASNDEHGAFLSWFFVFLCVSPLFYLVATVTTARTSGKTFTITPKFVWRFVALMIAYIVWACAISNDTLLALLGFFHFTPEQQSTLDHLRDIVSIVVLLASGALSAVDGLFP